MTSIQFQIQFVPNITHSFCEELLSLDPPFELSLSINELISSSPKSRPLSKHLKDRDLHKPPRPCNPFILYRRNFQASLTSTNFQAGLTPTNDISIASIQAVQSWEQEPAYTHYYFYIMSKAAQEVHSKRFENYQYRPQKKDNSRISRSNNNTKNNSNHDLPLDGSSPAFCSTEYHNNPMDEEDAIAYKMFLQYTMSTDFVQSK
ncbi:8892_t:CDS:1 [Racocetra fulgida]|uniref:8892_t:CDS:1 n=1 Tax=Racocetra fulgida TaxID=60492 RepID=A0A9N9H9C6_9GLOM|nr:8892_t:CDS:1 [Racocetra fulgida]